MAPRKRKADAAGEPAGEKKAAKHGLAAGDAFPALGPLETEESTADEKKTVDLTEVLKTSGIMLFFYPKANTPGCTTQACGFRDLHPDLSGCGYQVFGMSADKPKPQRNWKNKHSFPYHLLCDPSHEALKLLGVHKTAKSVHRSHIFVEKGGTVALAEYGVSPKDSIAAAKAFAEGKSAADGGDDAEPMQEAAPEAQPEQEAAPEAQPEQEAVPEAQPEEQAPAAADGVKVTLAVTDDGVTLTITPAAA